MIFCKANGDKDFVHQTLDILYENNVQSVIVEGGRQTLESFISQGLWDEARVFTSNQTICRGIKAPEFHHSSSKRETHNGISLDFHYNNDFYTKNIML